MYIIPSLEVVAVRLANTKRDLFNDSAFVSLLLRGQDSEAKATHGRR